MLSNFEVNPILREVKLFVLKFDSILYTFLNEMVEPVFSDKVPTAAVAFSRKDTSVCIHFIFNETFWNSLNYNEKIFVFFHEVLHVLFLHGLNGNNFLESLPEKMRSSELLNIAQDICINHIIVDQYLKDIPLVALPITQKLCFINTVFKPQHQSKIKPRQSFEYYYSEYIKLYGLKEPEDLELCDVHNFADDSQDSSQGDSLPQFINPEDLTPEELQDLTDAIEDQLDELNSSIEELLEKVAAPSQSFALNPSMPVGQAQQKDVQRAKSLDELFSICIKKAFSNRIDVSRKTNWFGFNRRTSLPLQSICPDLNLPAPFEKRNNTPKRHRICVYLDMSGSCASYSTRFMELTANLPEDKYECKLFVFADRTTPVTVSMVNNKKHFAYNNPGNGTSIQSVISTHSKLVNDKEHFDAVFVLTDGYYSNIRDNTLLNYKEWHFFMTPYFEPNIPAGSKFYKIGKL